MTGDNYNPFDTTRPIIPEVFGHAAYAERRLPDGLLAQWERSPLPEGVSVTRVMLVPYRGERPVLAWRDRRFWLPEGDVHDGEVVESAARRVALEQIGVSTLTAEHLGHLHCRATSASKSQAEGTETYRVMYAVDVQELADFPSDTSNERRIATQRDMNDMIRSHYVELRREYMEVIDLVVLERRKAAAQAASGSGV